MKRQLYFLFPDVAHVEQLVNELLSKHIDIGHIHVIANDKIELGQLPAASIFQKNDILQSVLLGLLSGAVIGIVAGILGYNMMNFELGLVLLVTTLIGSLIGVWAASMIGLTSRNVHLKPFEKAIEEGKLLIIVDIPTEQAKPMEKWICEHHPEANYKGFEPATQA